MKSGFITNSLNWILDLEGFLAFRCSQMSICLRHPVNPVLRKAVIMESSVLLLPLPRLRDLTSDRFFASKTFVIVSSGHAIP